MPISETQARALVEALNKSNNRFVYDLERLRDLASTEAVDEVDSLTRDLRDAVEFSRCLRRLVPELTARQIHRAFGAPGDFGYETPLGAALHDIYRAPQPDTEPRASGADYGATGTATLAEVEPDAE